MHIRFLIILFAVLAATAAAPDAASCTSAIIGPRASASGRPLLWKNRDTSAADNKIEYIPSCDGSLPYVALFNASDRDCREAWMGMNAAGFAVMNTASYNLKADNVAASEMDREGEVMTLALRTCTTVEDFAKLLDSLPRPLGVEANFGVIDAAGNGAYFETDNYSYTRFNLSDTPDDILVRTNYSHSGRPGEGYGFTREQNALRILTPAAAAGSVTAEMLTEALSRSFFNSTLGVDYSSAPGLVIDEGFIPRYKSTATVVVEGCVPAKDGAEINPQTIGRQYIMWTALGYPPCAEITPVWCAPDGVEEGLRGIGPQGHSPYCDKALALRELVFRNPGGEKSVYIDMPALCGPEGISTRLRARNLQIYNLFKSKRDGNNYDR